MAKLFADRQHENEPSVNLFHANADFNYSPHKTFQQY